MAPEVLAWHEIGGTIHGQDPVGSRAAAEALMSRYGLKVRGYQVNEYAEEDQQLPGRSAWFIARLERAGVDGLRANWGRGASLHDDLAGLLEHDEHGHRPRGDWYVYARYAAQVGRIAATSTQGPVDAFATLDEVSGVASILVGHHGEVACTARLHIVGMPAQDVAISVERLGSDGPSTDAAHAVIADGRGLSVQLDYADPRDAFVVSLMGAPVERRSYLSSRVARSAAARTGKAARSDRSQ
jgi:hypothetical protein